MTPKPLGTPQRNALLAKARDCPRCTIVERKPGQVIVSFLNAVDLQQLKRQLGKSI